MSGRRLEPSLNIADGFRLPLDYVTQTGAILAKRGAGKTYTAKVIAEELLEAGLPLAVIDPIGVWWGLRAGADGDPAGGYPITVLGGDHGDLPLEPGAGATIADLIVEERVSLILDLSLFRKAEARRFVTGFAERLYHRNRDALHVIVDEADAFAPQRSPKGDEAVLLGAMEDLVRRGRARGIGLTLVTQRAAVINKNVLTQTEVLFALRTTSPQDRAAIDAWVEAHGEDDDGAYDELKATLPGLPIGDAWVWSPGWLGTLERIHVRLARTFDSSATPKAGTAVTVPKALAEVDLEALRERMAETIDRANLQDPKKLLSALQVTTLERNAAKDRLEAANARIAELEEAAGAQAEPIEVFPNAKALAMLADRITDARGYLRNVEEQLESAEAELERANARNTARTNAPPAAAPVAPPQAASPTPRGIPRERAAIGEPNGITGGALRLLQALGRYPGGLTEPQAATMAKLKRTGGTFGTYLSRLRTHGLVVKEGNELRITEEGLDFIGGAPLPTDAAELREDWRRRLTGGARRMYDVLIDVFPEGLTTEELATRAGLSLSGGTFGTYLSRLRTNGLIDERSDATRVRANAVLWTEPGR
jgi:hypothetical protein